MSTKQYQVAIVGGGMVGAALACLLADSGVSVALMDAGDPERVDMEAGYDLRVSALTLSSVNLFKTLAVWPQMSEMGVQSIEKMLVWDHAGNAELEIDAADAGEIAMGYVVENRITVQALWQKLRGSENCDIYKSSCLEGFKCLDDRVLINVSAKAQISASLLVGADGSNSVLRQLSGIGHYGWDYQQKALVATVRPEKPHLNTAWQRFLPEGPLALLPLRDGLISIVWTSNTATTEGYLTLSETAFCHALAEASENRLGRFELLGKTAAFPLKMQFSTDYSAQRRVLIGDAIHTVHPLAGQGANLGLQDVISLAEVVIEAHHKGRDIASQQVLRRYERRRKGDNLLMMAIMDGFKRLFGADQALIQWVRSSGLGLINASSLLKNQICQYAMGLRR
tara:strand:+ start:293 stop:1480 length:1188 start_codon:yes stop_codon:yes gene_type:complete